MGPMAGVGEVNVVGVIGVFAILAAVAHLSIRWLAMWSPERVMARVAAGASSAWVSHLRWARSDFIDSLRMREEAFAELDGDRLGLADEFLREDLHQLGGLAGAW